MCYHISIIAFNSSTNRYEDLLPFLESAAETIANIDEGEFFTLELKSN